jgi:hypothetical protein
MTRIPDIEKAVVSREKLRDYVLSPTHPVGHSKAAWLRGLGYTRAGWRTLGDDLLAQHAHRVVSSVQSTPFGTTFVIVGPLRTPSGRVARVVSVWFLPYAGGRPRFVTMYPGDSR